MAFAAHPDIPGLTYQRDLGRGGFADVFLYRCASPDRLVAIKVLRTTDMSDRVALRFAAEGDAMAALAHPHIAQVFSTGVTPDGRPYIEMAYYPYGSLEDRVRLGPLSVPEVLRIGVQLCSAVETAHRLDPPLLHRDIKPANVLIDEYGDPVLTDFGIASRINDDDDEDASLSIFWASPEAMFSTSPVDRRSDVYSLGALLWHLLVGRAPFVIPCGDNGSSATMIRTRDLPAPSTGRPDVPAPLERLLAQTMSKDPELRPATPADLAKALNAIEQREFGFGRVTPFKIRLDASQASPVIAVPAPVDERTHLQPVLHVVDAQPAAVRRAPSPVIDSRTMRKPPQAYDEDTDQANWGDGARHKAVRVGIVALAVVIVVVVALVFWRPQGAAITGSSSSTTSSVAQPIGDAAVPPGPVTVKCARGADGATVSCEWTYAHNLDTDSYQVRLPDGTQVATTSPTYSGLASQWPYCVAVKVIRQDGRFPGDWSAEGCAQ